MTSPCNTVFITSFVIMFLLKTSLYWGSRDQEKSFLKDRKIFAQSFACQSRDRMTRRRTKSSFLTRRDDKTLSVQKRGENLVARQTVAGAVDRRSSAVVNRFTIPGWFSRDDTSTCWRDIFSSSRPGGLVSVAYHKKLIQSSNLLRRNPPSIFSYYKL